MCRSAWVTRRPRLPAIYGLYATIVPLAVYGLLGPSRILVLGPDSALAPLIAATILPLSDGDPSRALALASMLAILTGAFLVLIGVIRFGYVTDLLSLPIRYGYLNGIALAVIVSQLPKVFGYSVDAEGTIRQLVAFAEGFGEGQVVLPSLLIGSGSIVLVIVPAAGAERAGRARRGRLFHGDGCGLRARRRDRRRRLAAPRAAVVRSSARRDVGPAVASPQRSASRSLPSPIRACCPERSPHGSVVTSTRTMRSSRSALRTRRPACSRGSRSRAVHRGRRSPSPPAPGQLTGLVGAAVIAIVLVAAPSLFADLPQAALGGIVIVAASSLIEIPGVIRLARVRSPEFWLSVACFMGVAILGVLPGIFLSIGLALGQFVHRAWRPHDAVLGRSPGFKGYHDVTRHPEGRDPGLLLTVGTHRCSSPTRLGSGTGRCASFAARSRELDGSSWRPSRSPMSMPPQPRR